MRWINFVGIGGRLYIGNRLSLGVGWEWARFGLGAKFTLWTSSFMLNFQLGFAWLAVELER